MFYNFFRNIINKVFIFLKNFLELYSFYQQSKSESQKCEENKSVISLQSPKKYKHLNIDKSTRNSIRRKTSFNLDNKIENGKNEEVIEYVKGNSFNELDNENETEKLIKKKSGNIILSNRNSSPEKMPTSGRSLLKRSETIFIRKIQKEKEKITSFHLEKMKNLKKKIDIIITTPNSEAELNQENKFVEIEENELKNDEEYEKYKKFANFSEQEILNASYKNCDFKKNSMSMLSPTMKKIINEKIYEHDKCQNYNKYKKDECDLNYKDCSLCTIF